MVRKRAASSELLDLILHNHGCTASDDSNNNNNNSSKARFLRRSIHNDNTVFFSPASSSSSSANYDANVAVVLNSSQNSIPMSTIATSLSPSAKPTPFSNHSTIAIPIPISNPSHSNLNNNNNNLYQPDNLTPIATATSLSPPSVCVFSGLPLFPPHDPKSQPSTSAATPTPTRMDDISMEWIDGIIKDLMMINNNSSSSNIPQIIQNVRTIIHPCNPNLAVLLECRLRSLLAATSDISPPPPPLPHDPYAIFDAAAPGVYGVAGPRLSSKEMLPPALPPPPAAGLYRSTNIAGISHPYAMNRANSSTAIMQQQILVSSNLSTSPNSSSSNPLPQQQQLDEIRLQQEEEQQEITPPKSTSSSLRQKQEKQKRDEELGLHLLTLLLQCAEAVAAEKTEDANTMLLEISHLSTPFGSSAQRVAAYFSEAMSARLVNSCLNIYNSSFPLPPLYSHRLSSAFQVFNGISPFVKFSHFTANQAIQEAFESESRVHIIDLDIMQGLQWPGLFHILASRPGGPPLVRLTGLGSSAEALEATGKRLSEFAHKLGIPFEFHPVAEKVGNITDPERLMVSKREAVAVHWLQHSLYDVTGSDSNTLCLLQRLVTLILLTQYRIDSIPIFHARKN